MSARGVHLQQARANRTLASSLGTAFVGDPAARQWAITIAFYAAVHVIEAHLAQFGLHSASHTARKNWMADPAHGVPGVAHFAYLHLERWSRHARYDAVEFDEREVSAALNRYLPTVLHVVGL